MNDGQDNRMTDHALSKPRQYGVMAPEVARTLSGLEIMQGMMAGLYPAPPIAKTLGFDLVDVSAGTAVFACTPTLQHYNPLGGVHGGLFGTLLDSAMGCAVHTMMAAGQGYTTLEYKVQLVRGMTVKTGLVRAEGTVLHCGRRMATAEGRIVDATGKLYAHGTTTCLIFDA
jgi:uncharacterized protein (TIGR00369 family)